MTGSAAAIIIGPRPRLRASGRAARSGGGMRARFAALPLAVAAFACDEAETVISGADRRPGFGLDQLWTIQDPGGIPVEVHGRPFSHVSDRELVEALRSPAGASQVTFYPRPPGGWLAGNKWRLVLHFNQIGAPNAVADCQRAEEARTALPPKRGFEVTASFCEGPDWQAHGHLNALAIEDGDLEAFGDVMAQLMLAIFSEQKDR